MTDTVFWEVIEQSKKESQNFSEQIKILTKKVSSLGEKEIIDFEFRFREAISKLALYGIMAAAKIIQGYVSDDSFLYFRCRLIAEGHNLFCKLIESPEIIADVNIPELELEGEDMLYVSDNAFLIKFGDETNKELPRNTAINYLNYDIEVEIKGEDWKEDELPIKYPKLWKKYYSV